MKNNNQIKTSFYGTLENTTDILKAKLLLFESSIENDQYLTQFTETKIQSQNNDFKTHFVGSLSNINDILKATLVYYESIFREDPYLKSFKDYKKDSLEEFLE